MEVHSLESAIIHVIEFCTHSVDEIMSTVKVWVENAIEKEKCNNSIVVRTIKYMSRILDLSLGALCIRFGFQTAVTWWW